MITKRISKKKLWIFATIISLGVLLGYLESLGIQTAHSGDQVCGGSATCYGYFNFTVPTKVTNYLGELINITSLCFGSNMNVILTNPEKVSGLGLYKADRRYSANNPARWKKFNFTGSCLPTGINEFMINATKDLYSTVKWAIEGTNIDPVWKAQEKETFIGDMVEEEIIEVKSRSYIDQYLDFKFTKVNNTNWEGEFAIDKNFLTDLEAAMLYASSNVRWTNLKEKYFPTYTRTKVVADLKNISNYPLKSITSGIKLYGFNFNLTSGKGIFYIEFIDGFKAGEEAELGFGTTQIGTSSNTAFNSQSRAVCRDDGGIIHVTWKNTTTQIMYSNNTGGSFSTITILSGINSYPSIDCNGNNITIGNAAGTTVYVNISENRGGSWTGKTYVSGAAYSFYGWGFGIVRIGSCIYAGICAADSLYGRIYLFNSSNVGDSFTNYYYASSSCNQGFSFTANGTCSGGDVMLAVAGGEFGGTGSVSAYNSTVSTQDMNRTTFNTVAGLDAQYTSAGRYVPGGKALVAYGVSGIAPAGLLMRNSTFAAAANWPNYSTVYTTGSGRYMSVSPTGNDGSPWVFYFVNAQELDVGKINSTYQYNVYDVTGAYATGYKVSSMSTSMDATNGFIDLVFQTNGKLYYDYIRFDGQPDPRIIVLRPYADYYYTNNTLDCDALYTGADNGWMNFTWYKQNTTGTFLMGAYNGNASGLENAKRGSGTQVPAAQMFTGDSWTCQVSANNGTAVTAINTTVIMNIGPPTSVTLIPATIYKNTAGVNCSAVYNGNTGGSMNFSFYNNGVLQGTYNSTRTGLTKGSTVYAGTLLPNTTFVKDNVIICSARAYDIEYSSWVNSSSVTVSNSAPTIVYQQSYYNATGNFTIRATATDIDGLADISSCRKSVV